MDPVETLLFFLPGFPSSATMVESRQQHDTGWIELNLPFVSGGDMRCVFNLPVRSAVVDNSVMSAADADETLVWP